MTYARMETLRSPKQLLGPAYGMASLTFQAWFTAQFGDAAWEELFRIPRPMWMDYLRWYRAGARHAGRERRRGPRDPPRGDGLFDLDTRAGEPILARKVVLANGREGLGAAVIPGLRRRPATAPLGAFLR